MINYIKQEQKYGCVIACLAMVLNTDYWTAKSWFPEKDVTGKEIGTETGISIEFRGGKVLYNHGYLIYTKYPKSISEVEEFAPIHIISIDNDSGHAHACVLKDGIIYDPYKGIKKLSDYNKVNHIVGIWEIKDHCI